MSDWIQVTATFAQAPADWAMMDAVFERHGVPGTVQFDRPPTISGYYSSEAPIEFELLAAELREFGASKVESTTVQEQDWAEAWKQFFKPRRIGQRFVVRPTWEAFDSLPDDLVIVLDPGQAFGTGDHPTTRLCLELLETIQMAEKSVADIGCGSGILSVGACLLGAASVIAVDVDPVSVESTTENAERNGVKFDTRVGRGFDSIVDGEGPFDVVLSNIISAALIALAPEASRQVKSGGNWIVSGIIVPNWADVRAAAERSGFHLVAERIEGDWVAANFVRG